MDEFRRIRVLMLESGGWGGIHYYVHSLAEALVDQGVDLALLTNVRYELEDRPCHFRQFRVLRRENYLVTLFRFLRLGRRERPEILHLQSFISPRKDLALLGLGRLLGMRLVITVHNILPHEVRRGERQLYFCYYRLADALILHSEINRRELLALLPGLAPERVYSIPHGNYASFRDLELDQQEARLRLGLPRQKRIVLFLGAIRPYKGLDLFLQLVKPVRAACPEAFFVVAGPLLRGEQVEYERQIEALGLESEELKIQFAYLSCEETVAYVCASDLVVLPYRQIYQSGVLFLAYSFGRPVLATRVGSFPETIEEGRSGWLVEKEDVAGMAEALIDLLRQPERLVAAGAHARRLADEQYNWSGIAARTAQVYAEVARRR